MEVVKEWDFDGLVGELEWNNTTSPRFAVVVSGPL